MCAADDATMGEVPHSVLGAPEDGCRLLRAYQVTVAADNLSEPRQCGLDGGKSAVYFVSAYHTAWRVTMARRPLSVVVIEYSAALEIRPRAARRLAILVSAFAPESVNVKLSPTGMFRSDSIRATLCIFFAISKIISLICSLFITANIVGNIFAAKIDNISIQCKNFIEKISILTFVKGELI